MNDTLPDTLTCPVCKAVFEVRYILAHTSEFMCIRGEIECPECQQAKLDPSTRNQPKPQRDEHANCRCAMVTVLEDDVPMPEAFKEFIEGLAL